MQGLEAYLRASLPGLRGRMRIAPLGSAGSSFRLGFDDNSLLLRTEDTRGNLRRERRIVDALAANGVPVPKTLLVCDDPRVAGVPFYVADLPEGRVFAHYGLPQLPPAQRRTVYFAMAETMARLHRVDWAAAGLADYAGPARFFAREVAHWQQHGGPPGMARVRDWLSSHLPGDDESAIQHGDFRLGNLVFDGAGSKVLALYGWERAALGHPLADAAHSCIAWQLAPAAGGIRGTDLAQQGIPTQAEYLTHYRQCGGHAEGVTTFHLVFALLRAARAPAGAAALVQRALELIDGA